MKQAIYITRESFTPGLEYQAKLTTFDESSVSSVGVYGRTAEDAETRLREKYDCDGIDVYHKVSRALVRPSVEPYAQTGGVPSWQEIAITALVVAGLFTIAVGVR